MLLSPGVFFSYFQNFDFSAFRRVKGQKMTQNVDCHTLYLRNCRSHHQNFCSNNKSKRCKLMISPEAFLYVFFKKMQHCFLNKSLFFKFISKYQKDILRCAPPSSHVCDFFVNIPRFVYI